MKVKKLFFRSLLLLLVITFVYLLFFGQFYPEVKSLKEIHFDYLSWNLDKEKSSIETYYFIRSGRSSSPVFESTYQFINRKVKDEKREYSLRNKLDTVYYPSLAARFIIDHFNYHYTRDQHSTLELKNLLTVGDFLRNLSIQDDSTACWKLNFKYTSYDTPYSWTSSYQQGLVLSALTRIYQLTKSREDEILLKKAVRFCRRDLKHGGFLNVVSDTVFSYEEYPSEEAISSVLNGHIYSLFGLYDAYRVTNYPLAKELFDKGVNYLLKYLPEYDLGYWSKYDLKSGYAASYGYHKRTHIPQLRALYHITGEEIFKEYADKWEGYFKEPYYTIFKLKALKDAIARRFRYKSVFSIG